VIRGPPSFINAGLFSTFVSFRAFRGHFLAAAEVFVAPFDVVMAEDNTAQPDLLFIATANAGIVQNWVFGAPDLVVEILSPSSIRRDRYEKQEQYARFGVKEYWIVDPANRSLEILTLQDQRFTVHSSAVETGEAASQVLAGLIVDVAQLF
jgi:Uma2 family endonuclease